MKNPVAKHLNTFNKTSVIAHKKTSLKSDAILRDARELLSESQFDSESMCFDRDLQGCLDCVGCSNIEIDCEAE